MTFKQNKHFTKILPHGTPRRSHLLSRNLFIFTFAAAFTFVALKFPVITDAVSASEFTAGNIISDYTMSNYQSMTLSEIQTFLSEKGNCQDTGIERAAQYPKVHYHVKDEHFVCLADELFATSGTNYGDLLTDAEKQSAQTAAEIIYEIAQKYQINPQVLIVLLEKEQGLITDSWPNSSQYRSATGFGCPDTAACDSKYYGLKNQLESAAKLFRSVLDGGWTNYPLGENYIQYNPSANCGGSIVNIENLATSALYRYTPYQPNQAALDAGYGAAPCGAYGNRNFYLYFSSWFGNPKAEKPKNEKSKDEQPKTTSEPNQTDSKAETSKSETSKTEAAQTGDSSKTEAAQTGDSKTRQQASTSTQDTSKESVLESIIPTKIDINYKSHIQNIGWQDWVKNGEQAGTTGQSLRLEAINIKLDDAIADKFDIYYRAHIQNIGWQDWVKNGEQAGTTGQSLRLEAINIKLDDAIADKFDIYYRAHIQNIGWQDWVKNGEQAGTTGQGLRLEALEIKVVAKVKT